MAFQVDNRVLSFLLKDLDHVRLVLSSPGQDPGVLSCGIRCCDTNRKLVRKIVRH